MKVEKKMLLTICIPSYNRFNELSQLLQSIVKARSKDFDVFVVDNGSKEEFDDAVLFDKRIHFIKRNEVVPGPINVRTCLDYGDGKYRLLCLDKDYIYGMYLDDFINKLKLINVPCGYCALNCTDNSGKFYINKKTIDKTIYRCGHPSGYFFCEDVIEKDNQLIDKFDINSIFFNNPFLLDLLYTTGLCFGNEAIYYGKLISPESLEKAKKTKSYTYTEKNNNIYFMPSFKKQQFLVWIRHMGLLDISPDKKIRVIRKLFKNTLLDCTLSYRRIMKEEAICSHYGIECRNITFEEIYSEARQFTNYFLEIDIGITRKRKLTMVLYAWLILIGKYILDK